MTTKPAGSDGANGNTSGGFDYNDIMNATKRFKENKEKKKSMMKIPNGIDYDNSEEGV